MLVLEFTEGPILDIFGRKIPVLMGMTFGGIGLFCMPLFKSVFP